jgi:hypothetical protein
MSGWLARAWRSSGPQTGGDALGWLLGWLPDFFYALGVSAVILAVLEVTRFPAMRRWSAVLVFLAVALTIEFRSRWTARGTFAWADVVAFVAGAVLAVAIDRWGAAARPADADSPA